MPVVPFSFTGVQPNPDQTYQVGLDQYLQQGQSQINPGQAQVAAANPIQSAGMANLAKALQQSQKQGVPAQQASVGPDAPISNLPIAPGIYQSPQALDNATGALYPSPYAAQQSQSWLQRMASGLMGDNNGS